MALPPRDGSALSSPTQYGESRKTDWIALAVALLTPMLIVQFSVVRPTNARLEQMRSQVARLESTIQDLHEKSPDAQRVAGLLEALAKQQDMLADAETTLEQITALEQRLAEDALTLDRIDRLSSRLEQQAAKLVVNVGRQTELLSKADDTLASLAQVPNRLEASIAEANRVAPTVGQVKALRDRLAQTESLTAEARKRTEKVLAHQQQLVKDTKQVESARKTLEGLARLEERLNSPLMAVDASHERLDDLLALKEEVIARTEDLPDAFDTLELMVDIGADMQRASGSLRTAQKLITDLVLLEPSLSRVASVMQPALKQSTIAALGGSELRLVLRELRQRHAEARAGLEEAVASKPQEESVK